MPGSPTGGRKDKSMADNNRPLSPHLQIYRWEMHMVTSILHRITGAALGLGTIFLTWWLMALAAGPSAYETFATVVSSLVGQIILFGFSYGLFYHLLNGIRHLYWDAGLGFEPATVRLTGPLVMVASFVLTVVTWLAAYYLLGKL